MENSRQREFDTIDTVIKLFERSVSLYGGNTLMLEKIGGKYTPFTYNDIKREAQLFAAGLLSLGVAKGDRIALWAEGRKDWLVCELGMFYVGVVNVPLSVKLDAATEVTFRVVHSGARMLIVSGNQAAKAEAVMGDMPQLESLIYLDATGAPVGAPTFQSICESGKQWLSLSENAERFAQVTASVAPDDLANISYTSGTTADPKGIMLSQHNYAANTLQSCSRITIDQSCRTLTILPWDHSFAHTACLYCLIYYGAAIAAQEIGRTPIETLKNIPKNIKEIRPDLIMSVPALSKAFRKNIENGIRQKGKAAERMFGFFLKVAYAYNGQGFNRGKGWRILLAPLNALGDKLLFSKVREGFGGNLKFFIGGGALLDIELQRFFAAVGMPIMQGYGLSEASPVISANALHACKFGSSGMIVDFMDLKICDAEGAELPKGNKGEIVIRGHNVMQGYWRNEQASAESLRDGWLHTGDMGYVDADGFLYVLGRFKSLLIGNDGEKYSPEGIEESLVDNSPYIDQCMLYNNQCAYTVGFVVPNMSALRAYAQQHGADAASEQGITLMLEKLQHEVNEYKAGGRFAGMFPERWLPAAVAVLPEAFTEQNKMLNSTMKMVRARVTEAYAKELSALYQPQAKNIVNSGNADAMRRWK